MTTLTRKQREILQREKLILETARPMLVEQGYHGLNMDRLAEVLEYSKGTIYNHFSCKEEIIIALAIETLEKRTVFFERAAAFPGLPRERMLAVGVAADLFVRLYTNHFQVEQIIRSASIWEKTSETRRKLMRSCETRCIGIVAGIVRDAISRRELEMPDQGTPEELVFGLWSMSMGAYQIITTSESLHELGIREPFDTLRDNQTTLLDGYGWRPLAADHDYRSVSTRIEEELFGHELAAVQGV